MNASTPKSNLYIQSASYVKGEGNYPLLYLKINGKDARIHSNLNRERLEQGYTYLEGCLQGEEPKEPAYRTFEEVLDPLIIEGKERYGFTSDPRVVRMAKDFISAVEKNIFTERKVEIPPIDAIPLHNHTEVREVSKEESLNLYNATYVEKFMNEDENGSDYQIVKKLLEEFKEEILGKVIQAIMYTEYEKYLENRRQNFYFPGGIDQAKTYHHMLCEELSGQGSDATDGLGPNLTGKEILGNSFLDLKTCAQGSLEKIFPHVGYREGKKPTVTVYTTESRVRLQGLEKSDTREYDITHLKRYPIVTGWFGKPPFDPVHPEILGQEVDIVDVYALFTDSNEDLRVAFTPRFCKFKYLATPPKLLSEIKADESANQQPSDSIIDDVSSTSSFDKLPKGLKKAFESFKIKAFGGSEEQELP